MLVTKPLTVATDVHSMKEKNTMEVNGCQQIFACQRSSEWPPLCSAEERIQVWKNLSK